MKKRKNYFIEKGLQSQIIVAFIVLTVFVLMITMFNLYFLSQYMVANTLEPSEYIQFSSMLSRAFSMLKYKIYFLIGLDVIIVFIVSLFISHQLAGPGYKIKKSITKIKDGNLNFKVVLREGDKFDDIANELNALIRKNSMDVNELITIKDKFKTALRTKDDQLAIETLAKLEEHVNKFLI
ncbi:MAG: hypothetical protein C0601_13550 [Candidatus Muiribacterium halophilum]|uniref:HAMP domain-containing protein n=1 Tax=Muiribacterium halophilum TaxID=2053465 RepID=A0A2N5Z9F6_MUIH1|nr:MAG: hypothetical protein C0601_13550 [Candidatus Muirbacterium halophilum]